MPRIDVWDKHLSPSARVDCGYPRNFDEEYTLGDELGKGGFGQVRVAVSRATGKEYACKTIRKSLDAPGVSPVAQAAHLANLEKEVSVLRRLQGTLSVVHLESVFEDEAHVHIVMEYCRGGELLHHVSHVPHYSEETAAEILRGVMRTLQQCHSNNILHRDIKPGNFMLLDAPDDLRRSRQQHVKAIDFGLAVFFDPKELPRTDLGLEGTPWFMAPEVLSSQYFPASDVWSAGIMAYQLLTGRLPFDDRSNPTVPALSKVWKSILSDPLPTSGKTWAHLSVDARDFVTRLLQRDPMQRPTAKEALAHPWLVAGKAANPAYHKPLRHTVVQRLQHYALGVAQGNALRQSIFELIAQELLNSMNQEFASPKVSMHGGNPAPYDTFAECALPESWQKHSLLLGSVNWEELSLRGTMSAYGGLQGTLRTQQMGDDYGKPELARRSKSLNNDTPNYWQIMRAALAAGGGKQDLAPYLRTSARSPKDRAQQIAISRLALDTAAAKGDTFKRYFEQLQRRSPLAVPADATLAGSTAISNNPGSTTPADASLRNAAGSPAGQEPAGIKSGNAPAGAKSGDEASRKGKASGLPPISPDLQNGTGRFSACGTPKQVDLSELREVMKCLNFSREAEVTTVEAVGKGLSQLGYELAPDEVRSLTRSVSSNRGEDLSKAAFFASQVDWHSIQTHNKELWLEACKRVFADLDSNKNNALKSEDLVKHLREKLPQAEIDCAVENALQSAGHADAETLDFEGFLRLVSQEDPSFLGELEHYDDRMLSGIPSCTPELQADFDP
eukprot:jgi/Botrbrau1/22947/Bobra.0030s0022.1